MILALLCFAALDTTTKLATVAPVVMALWLRYLVQTVGTFTACWPSLRTTLFQTRRPRQQALRVVLAIACGVIGYLGLRHMPVGEYTAISTLTPMLLTVAAAWRLGERVASQTWICIAAGFAGTLAMVRPGPAVFRIEALIPVLLAIATTAYQLLTRDLAKTDKPTTIHFYSGAGGLLVTSLLLPLVWEPLSSGTWALLLLAACFGSTGHFMVVVAFAGAPVASLAPYLYLQILFATLAGWVIFGHIPDTWSLIGMGAIAAAGIASTRLALRNSSQ